jgi:PAS domain S-box-containing protein
LDALLAGLRPALERVNVPIYVIGREGRIAWLNKAARRLVGDVMGREFTSVVAPEHTLRAREAFVRKLLGAEVTDFDVNLLDREGRRVRAEVSSVPLQDRGQLVGVFGVVRGVSPPAGEPLGEGAQLTPRQYDVVALLAEGCSTEQIADELGVSVQTVRNHVRELMRRLGVRSRIAAVATARRQGLL